MNKEKEIKEKNLKEKTIKEKEYIMFSVEPMTVYVATVVGVDGAGYVDIQYPISFSPNFANGKGIVTGFGLSGATMLDPHVIEQINLDRLLTLSFNPPQKIIDIYEQTLTKIKAQLSGLVVPNNPKPKIIEP